MQHPKEKQQCLKVDVIDEIFYQPGSKWQKQTR